jgi:hypothetical protein
LFIVRFVLILVIISGFKGSGQFVTLVSVVERV